MSVGRASRISAILLALTLALMQTTATNHDVSVVTHTVSGDTFASQVPTEIIVRKRQVGSELPHVKVSKSLIRRDLAAKKKSPPPKRPPPSNSPPPLNSPPPSPPPKRRPPPKKKPPPKRNPPPKKKPPPKRNPPPKSPPPRASPPPKSPPLTKPPPPTKSPTASPPPSPSTTDIGNPDDWLEGHNDARQALDIPLLSWSQEIARSAGNWAAVLAKDGCGFYHGGNATIYGQNLVKYFGPSPSPQVIVKFWVDEKQWYTYGPYPDYCQAGKVCGHYTQVIWYDTEYLGCGKARCNSGYYVYVCEYDPPGNWGDEYPY